MKSKSYLEEIEDYNFALRNLIYKDLSERETAKLLENRGVDPKPLRT